MIEILFSGLVSLAVAVLAFILQIVIRDNRRLKKEKEERVVNREIALENGVRQLLSVQLEQMYYKFSNSNTIPRRAYDRWMKLHSAYKGLHGNGTFDHMHEEIEEKHIIND